MKFGKAKAYILARLKKDLPVHLSYHSVEHILDVYKAARQLAKAEHVNRRDTTLLLTAVLFHDSGFLINAVEHEKHSCGIVRDKLPSFEYSSEEIDIICGMIMATKVPQVPYTHLEQIICDADLDYLGRQDFFEIGNRLFTELVVFGVLQNENDWNKMQVRFLENHQFFTDTAKNLRQATKQKHLDIIRSKVHD